MQLTVKMKTKPSMNHDQCEAMVKAFPVLAPHTHEMKVLVRNFMPANTGNGFEKQDPIAVEVVQETCLQNGDRWFTLVNDGNQENDFLVVDESEAK